VKYLLCASSYVNCHIFPLFQLFYSRRCKQKWLSGYFVSFLFLFLLGLYACLALGLSTACNSTTVPLCGILVGSHTLRVCRNHRPAARMTETARNRVLVPFDFGTRRLKGDVAIIIRVRVLFLYMYIIRIAYDYGYNDDDYNYYIPTLIIFITLTIHCYSTCFSSSPFQLLYFPF